MIWTKPKKFFFGSIIFLLILSGALYWAGVFIIKKSLPQIDGDHVAEGLVATVEVYRDQYGMPHIMADNEHDLMFSAGYVQAQDRLWQMDLLRRVAAGRLSEILGTKTLEADKFLRTIGLMRTAKMIADSLDSETRTLLQAYSDGVNLYLREHFNNYPIEFTLLGYEPYPWEIEHTVAMARVMAWQLNMGWYVDVMYAQIADSVGNQKMFEILPRFPDDAPTIVGDKPALSHIKLDFELPKENSYSQNTFDIRLSKSLMSMLTRWMQINEDVKTIAGFDGSAIGSNNWVVDGRKSTTGKPILANDPHLAHSAPSTWYEMHLSGGRFDVTGFTFPGVPMIVLGNNRNIAWGFTNVMTDDADFYVETIRDGRFLLNGKWNDLTTIYEEIKVKDSAAVLLPVSFTSHGPVISDFTKKELRDEQAIAMRWLGHYYSNEVKAIYKLNLARDWQEFREATRYFKVPGQNVVYADNDGNIGYQCMSGIPIRRSGNGIALLDGTTSLNDWQGIVPFEQLPYTFNPSDHYVASANNKTAGNWFPYFISNYWEHPSRVKRIHQFLKSKEKISVEDCKILQQDFYSFHAAEVAPFLLKVLSSDSLFTSDEDKSGYQKLYHEAYLFVQHWDYVMAPDSRGAAIFNVFFQKLLKNTFEDEMGSDLFKSFITLSNIPTRITTQLLSNNTSPWWDDQKTLEKETRDAIIKKSFVESIEWLKSKIHEEPAGWKWGTLHTVTFEHLIGKQKPFDRLFNVGPFSVGGNTTTVNNTEYHYNDERFNVLIGASMRRIVDFSDRLHPMTILTVGQSGQPYSDFYQDQTPMWLDGLYKTVSMNQTEIEKYPHKLILKPKTED
ncbi:penicillin acylase family protein [bacterium]|nr:penicillin acylase family protein [bacterium]